MLASWLMNNAFLAEQKRAHLTWALFTEPRSSCRNLEIAQPCSLFSFPGVTWGRCLSSRFKLQVFREASNHAFRVAVGQGHIAVLTISWAFSMKKLKMRTRGRAVHFPMMSRTGRESI